MVCPYIEKGRLHLHAKVHVIILHLECKLFREEFIPGTREHTPRLGRSLSKSVQLAAIYVPSLQSRVCLVLRNRLQCNVTTGGCFKGELNYNRGRCKQRVYNAMPVFETYNKNTIDIN